MPALQTMIGQLLIVGFRGFEIAAGDPIARDLAEKNLGGVIYFDRDLTTASDRRNIQSPQQLKALSESVRRMAQTSPFIGVDQEGGFVARLKPKHGFPTTLSALKMAVLPVQEFEAACDGLAKTLADAGINLNFAPVLDVNVNPQCPAIGKYERSFSADPDVVAQKGIGLIDAHRRAGVVTSLKHFPGHGSATGDTHLGMVEVTETWKELELHPFAEIIKADRADIVMTAHVFNRKLDDKYPATLSPRIVRTLLREKMAYDGVVISDDMQMGAIAQHFGLREALRLGIEADVDMFCFGNNVAYDDRIAEKVIAAIQDLVEKGEVSEARIERSFRRIQRLKERLNRLSP